MVPRNIVKALHVMDSIMKVSVTFDRLWAVNWLGHQGLHRLSSDYWPSAVRLIPQRKGHRFQVRSLAFQPQGLSV